MCSLKICPFGRRESPSSSCLTVGLIDFVQERWGPKGNEAEKVSQIVVRYSLWQHAFVPLVLNFSPS